MNMTTTTADRAVSTATFPPPSSALEWEMDRMLSHGWDHVRPPSRAILDEAAMQLARFRALCLPVTLTRIETWIERVALACPNPPDKGARSVRASSVFETSGDTCMGAWTRETRARFSREQTFFPGDGEVDRFIRPISDRLRVQFRALIAMQNPPKPPEREHVDEETRQKIARGLSDLAASMRAKDADTAVKTAPGTQHLSVEARIAAYDAQSRAGGPLAEIAAQRARYLRGQLGA